MGKRKTGKMNPDAIGKLSAGKPVVYKIRNQAGNVTYIGSAKRGRVQERIAEHLPGGPDAVPGAASVNIEQKASIAKARESEARAIKKTKPRHNQIGK
jgi:excinuclease UvrABC nuclease subunit